MKLPVKIPYWELIKRWGPIALIAVLAVLLFLSHAHGNSLETQLEAEQTKVSTLTTSLNECRQSVRQRNELLGRQSASILKLEQAAAADRTRYLSGIASAQSVSAVHSKAASQLLSLSAPDGELSQCRAARQLLEDELTR